MKLQYVGPISPIFVPEHNEYLDIETGDVVEFTDTLGDGLLLSENWERPKSKAADEALAAVAAGPQSYEDALEQAREHDAWLADARSTPVEDEPEAKPATRAAKKRAPKKRAPKNDRPAPPADDVSPDGE